MGYAVTAMTISRIEQNVSAVGGALKLMNKENSSTFMGEVTSLN